MDPLAIGSGRLARLNLIRHFASGELTRASLFLPLIYKASMEEAR